MARKCPCHPEGNYVFTQASHRFRVVTVEPVRDHEVAFLKRVDDVASPHQLDDERDRLEDGWNVGQHYYVSVARREGSTVDGIDSKKKKTDSS